MVLRTLSENLSEKSDAVPPPGRPSCDHSADSESSKGSQGPGTSGTVSSKRLWLSLLCMKGFKYRIMGNKHTVGIGKVLKEQI